MKEIKIEHLAYILKEAKEGNKPQPIFFLGAGASRSGNIPLAGEIVTQISNDYEDSPFVRDLPKDERTYAKLMDCLQPDQRDELLKRYIAEAKINVTHIYLAQLLKEGFADYVLTVNFDNLMLRALALYNIFPATYDMAILNDWTTSTFKEGSVVYLHGQSHGLWLLNTPSEMEKVRTTVPRILDSIKNKRPWIFIGYSGEDPIFEHIKKLGRFDNGLFWVTYKDRNPSETVQAFLSEPNTNASLIKGYDADSFMLRLNSALGLGQPNIIVKPFTALKDMLTEIVDIDDQEHFKDVKERLNIAQRQVEEAIRQFELGEVETQQEVATNKIELLKKEIINLTVSEKWNKEVIEDIEKRAQGIHDKNLNNLFSTMYINWGVAIRDIAENVKGAEAESLFMQSIEKYNKAIDFEPDNYYSYNNLGSSIGGLAELKKDTEAEMLYRQSFEKFQKAIEIKPDKHEAYYNWGTYLGKLADIKIGETAEALYQETFEKFQKAIEFKSDSHEAYYNWGTYLGKLADMNHGVIAETLYQEAFEKFQKAIEIKPDKHEAYYNWGTYLGKLADISSSPTVETLYLQALDKYQRALEIKPDKDEAYLNWGIDLAGLAKLKEGVLAEDLYQQAFRKFQKAIEIKPDKHKAYYSWGVCLDNLAELKEGREAEILHKQALEKYQKSFELGGNCYNLACWYAKRKDKQNALKYLEISLVKKELIVPFAEADTDWEELRQDADFIGLLDKYRAAS